MGTGVLAKTAVVGTLNQLPKNLKKWFGILEAHLENQSTSETVPKNPS
jgi:hypothetical protein